MFDFKSFFENSEQFYPIELNIYFTNNIFEYHNWCLIENFKEHENNMNEKLKLSDPLIFDFTHTLWFPKPVGIEITTEFWIEL